jgi:hypothetical protein
MVVSDVNDDRKNTKHNTERPLLFV